MKQTIAFLGPSGTYSEMAAHQLFGAEATFVPCETLDAVVYRVESGQASAGVLPIENSTEGSVHRTLDLLAKTELAIQQEMVLPIRHQLLSKAANLHEITEVWAHPQALAQCRAWLAAHVPDAAQHAARSNGEAAQFAAQNPHAAAIASANAADVYGLHALAASIADNQHNTTRFVAVGAKPAARTGSDKTSLVCRLSNKAGSLYGLLGIFARHGVNLTKLESRPLPDSAWDYLFYIDCDGHQTDAGLAAALKEVKKYAVFYRLLGSYPRATELQS